MDDLSQEESTQVSDDLVEFICRQMTILSFWCLLYSARKRCFIAKHVLLDKITVNEL
uniref:Uncharacterized protein n=1 Tax=Arundo donax TaxID=35708 RepID=A0A0A9CIS0_ARUDO